VASFLSNPQQLSGAAPQCIIFIAQSVRNVDVSRNSRRPLGCRATVHHFHSAYFTKRRHLTKRTMAFRLERQCIILISQSIIITAYSKKCRHLTKPTMAFRLSRQCIILPARKVKRFTKAFCVQRYSASSLHRLLETSIFHESHRGSQGGE
jgi:hypothetical protein